MRHTITIIVSILIFASCKSLKNAHKLNPQKALISMIKEPCPNNCSAYNLHVYKDGTVVYEGVKNAIRYGVHAMKISKSDMKNLTLAFDRAQLKNFKDNYPTYDGSLPIVTLRYATKDFEKQIRGSVERPKELLELQKLLETIANQNSYVPTHAKIIPQAVDLAEGTRTDSLEEAVIIENQIIVEPGANTFMAQWLKKYEQYDVQLMTRISPTLNLWVITFNMNLIAPNDMLQLIKNDPQISNAEFNKKLSLRSR